MKHEQITNNVKILGRTIKYKDILWCTHSGSGISFRFKGTNLSVILRGDSSTQGQETEGLARFGIYVNGIRLITQMMQNNKECISIIKQTNEVEVEVQIVKLSECAMSTFGIESLMIDETAQICAMPNKSHKIEFIGDSITCGYGVDMNDPSVGFQTNTQDVTKAFAYLTAQNLNADYSMVCFSGYGVVSGYTDTDEKNVTSLVPTYYEKVGFSYARPMKELKLEEQKWDFSKYVPELIVVNLGTNDASYCKEYKERMEEYIVCYVDFLKIIRKNNPDATIITTLGLMGQSLYPSLERAIECYTAQTRDKNIFSVLLDEQKVQAGYVSDSHPSAQSHQQAADTLTKAIQTILGW